METLPFMPFDVDAYLSSSSVGMLSDAEQGQYIRFMCHSWKQGGKLWKRKGDGVPTLPEIACLLRMTEADAEKLLASLIDKGCILQDVMGVFYNKRCFEDRQKVEKKVSAGRAGGLKSKPPEKTLKNLRNYSGDRSKKASKSLAPSEASSEASSEANKEASSEAKRKHPRNKLELELDIYNTLSIAQARATEQGDVEANGFTIEPPPGMPRSEDDAIAMAELAGVPADFIRERAYPKILSIGFREGNTLIRHFGQWAKLYYCNWQNKEKRNQKFEKKDNYMYNSKIKLPEL
ncbi:MAG: YdaU family protein [Verrucomicrobia bacterium]|nr:YdaU family protein [Verrucomicrobiota bacterium]